MEQSSFFDAIITNNVPDRMYSAKIFARYFSAFIGNGVFPNPSTGLQVIASDNNMSVRVKSGQGWINGYYYENSDDLILHISNADGVLHRIDSIVLRLDFINREIRIHVKKGTFSSSPIAPVLVRDTTMYELCLANVRVSNGVLAITQSSITDTRLNKDVCGIVTGVVNQVDTTTLYNQIQADLQEKGLEMSIWLQEAKDYFTTWLSDTTTKFDSEFNTWFDGIKGALDGDIAGNLLNRIIELENTVNNLELTSTSVMRPSGKNVEESLLANETSISNAERDINTNSIKIQNIESQLVQNIKLMQTDVNTIRGVL